MQIEWQPTDTIDAQPTRVDGQQRFDEPFPLLLANSNGDATPTAAAHWVATNRGAIELAHDSIGVLLFRNFGLRTDADFDQFIRAFDYPNFTYEDSLSNAVRVNRTERVFTANEAPPDVDIVMHHEMAQTPLYPSRLLFFCEKAAERAGQTPLCRSDVLLERVRERYPDFVSDCERLGLKYTSVMPDQADSLSGQGRSWRSTLSVDSRTAAEQRLSELGYDWQWLPDGELRVTTGTLPAIRTLADDRKTFFNQLISAYYGWASVDGQPAVCYGDGSALPADALDYAIAQADKLAFDTPWEDGDVALVNNFLVMHGRRAFQGTRKVLASLVA